MGQNPRIMLSKVPAMEFNRWLNTEGLPFKRIICELVYKDIHIIVFQKSILYWDRFNHGYTQIQTVYTNPIHTFRVLINYGVLKTLFEDFPYQMNRFSTVPRLRTHQARG